MYADDIAMLDTQIMPHNPIDSSATVVKVVVGKNDQYSLFPLLAFDEHSVATEQLKSLHSIV